MCAFMTRNAVGDLVFIFIINLFFYHDILRDKPIQVFFFSVFGCGYMNLILFLCVLIIVEILFFVLLMQRFH